jgi:hypothetical protein
VRYVVPPPLQQGAELTLYAAMGVAAAFGVGLLAMGVRALIDERRKRAGGKTTIVA